MAQQKSDGAVSGQSTSDMSEDPRVAHTKSVLKEGLMALLMSGDWDDISVAAIARQAGVARSSFYEHYRTKADLLDQVFYDMMVTVQISPRPDANLMTLDWLFDHVASAEAFFARAMEGGRRDAILPRFRRALIRQVSLELTARGMPQPHDTACFVVGGAMTYLASSQGPADRARLHEMAHRLIKRS